MRNYIILNGQNSNNITGLLIQSLAPISKPQMRTQIEEIDGRNGDIVEELGFASYDKQITIGLFGNFNVDDVIAYFNSKGTVIFSNEPDKYYNYQITDQIDFERLVRFKTATVTMHCQPFKYSTVEGAETLSPSDNLLSIPDATKTSNGVTVTSANGVITVQGTPTAATEIYLPITSLTLQAGSYTLDATANGQNPSNCSMRLIGSAPSNADSFGGKFITLADGTVSLQATLSASKTFGFVWFYINAGKALNFKLTVEVEDDATKTATGEDSALVLENTAEAPFNRLDLKGNAIQDGTPTPSALVQVQTVTGDQTVKITGKNLHGGYPNGFSVNNRSGIDFVSNADGTISANGTATDNALSMYLGNATATGWVRTYPAGTYTLSGGNSKITVYFSATDGSTSYQTSIVTGDRTFTLSEPHSAYIRIQVRSGETVNETISPQLELSSTATEYEPYHEQSYEVNLGKNLACIERSGTVHSITFTSNGDGSFSMSGTSTATSAFPLAKAENYVYMKAGTYFLSANNPVANSDVTIRLRDSGGATSSNWSLALSTTNATRSITLSADKILCVEVRVPSGVTLSNFVIKPQLEVGSVGTSYAQYFKPIELVKIDDYQDYFWNDNGTWKIHKETDGTIFSGSESITLHSTQNDIAGFRLPIAANAKHATSVLANYFNNVAFTNYYSNRTYGMICSHNATDVNTLYVSAPDSSITTAAQFQTWLTSNPTTVYYALTTPTDTAITDEGLISQLEALTDAHSYKERTHITALATTGNAPHIITAEAAKNSDGVVTNSGNIYSKPKLTIYGSGDISVYLNAMQVFQIALGDTGYITIDTNAMEAYQDTTDNLKNRLVTGDYNNFALQVGENQITFSGTVTKCIVENYSRWL